MSETAPRRAVCQDDLPSALSGLELTLWTYTLTSTAGTSITWSAGGFKNRDGGRDQAYTVLLHCMTKSKFQTAKDAPARLTLSFKRLHSAPEGKGIWLKEEVAAIQSQTPHTSGREHLGVALPGSRHGLGSKVLQKEKA
jgi:hypothetical protein